MNFPFYIAKRYLFSKKKTNVINLISGISMLGVAVATMAMVVTLSAFNGFSDLVATLFTSFDPELKVTPVEGKTTWADDPALESMRKLPQVEVATDCLEDQALVVYGDRQAMVMLKGVDRNFEQLTNIDDILEGYGRFELQLPGADVHYGILGRQLADIGGLGTGYEFGRHGDTLWVYSPRREGQFDASEAEEAFEKNPLFSPRVVFNVKQSKYDRGYILTSLGFARRQFDQQGRLSSLEIKLKPGSDFESVKKEMRRLGEGRYHVEDRFEQQDDTFSIMKIEKLIAYLFLTFILVVACFNIIGSLSMLIIDKREDVTTLRHLGATDRQITQVFLFEGRLISAIGAIVGIGIGLLLCWLQQEFELVKLGESEGSFIVNAYPISVHPLDVVIIFLTVMAVSFLAVWYPVRYFSKRLLS